MTATAEPTTYGLYIGGEESTAASGESFDAINPTSGRPASSTTRCVSRSA
jgi:hypothetical protein